MSLVRYRLVFSIGVERAVASASYHRGLVCKWNIQNDNYNTIGPPCNENVSLLE